MQPFAQANEIEAFRSECAAVADWQDYSALSVKVRAWPNEKQWRLLLGVLFSFKDEPSDRIAGFLLIDVEPKPLDSLQRLISVLATSHWYVSNRELPFYLLVCFGKAAVLSAIDSALSVDSTSRERTTLEGLRYWARHTAASLADRLHYFEWQEAIERGNG